MNTKNKPLISVIVPTYNRAHIISRAIRSIFSQGYDYIEVIIVDDASSDNTEEVVKAFQKDNIIYRRLSNNSGASAARNEGINIAKGDFIAFLDSDDEWLSDMINRQLAIFKNNPTIDASFTAFIRHYGNNPEYIAPTKKNNNKKMLESLLRNNFITAQTLMLKRACINELGGFDESLSHREDWDLGIRLISSKKFYFIDQPLAVVYETPGNLSSMTEEKIDTLEKFIIKHYELLKNYPAALSQHYYYLGHNYMLLNKNIEGMKNFKQSLNITFSLKSFVSLCISVFGCKTYKLSRMIFHIREKS